MHTWDPNKQSTHTDYKAKTLEVSKGTMHQAAGWSQHLVQVVSMRSQNATKTFNFKGRRLLPSSAAGTASMKLTSINSGIDKIVTFNTSVTNP